MVFLSLAGSRGCVCFDSALSTPADHAPDLGQPGPEHSRPRRRRVFRYCRPAVSDQPGKQRRAERDQQPGRRQRLNELPHFHRLSDLASRIRRASSTTQVVARKIRPGYQLHRLQLAAAALLLCLVS